MAAMDKNNAEQTLQRIVAKDYSEMEYPEIYGQSNKTLKKSLKKTTLSYRVAVAQLLN